MQWKVTAAPLHTAWWRVRQCRMAVRPWDELRSDAGFRTASIAIVGNAGYLAHLEQGERIDAHDVVVRMNDFRVEGFERHVGSRLDLFLSTFSGDVSLSQPVLNSARWLVASVPNNFVRGRQPRLNYRHGEQITAGIARLRRCEAFAPSREYFCRWMQQIGRYPTTGAMGILLALDYLLPSCGSIYVTGFSFFQGASHYFCSQQITPRNHDVDRERFLLRERLLPHVASGRIKLDDVLAGHLQIPQPKAA